MAALGQLPALLDAKGLLEEARAQSTDLVVDTFSGLVVMFMPGNDAYSIHQGQRTNHPGAIASGGVRALIEGLDKYVPASVLGSFGASLPASGGVAAALNHYALQVNPAAPGPFLSQFARLKLAEKTEVFRRFESDPLWNDTEVKFVSGILPGFATFVTWNEAGRLNPDHRTLSSKPLGWQLSRYKGVAEGRHELKGYYQGRRAATPTPRRRRRRARSRRAGRR